MYNKLFPSNEEHALAPGNEGYKIGGAYYTFGVTGKFKYDDFITACNYFPDFGQGAQGKREIAAFLANVTHETNGYG